MLTGRMKGKLEKMGGKVTRLLLKTIKLYTSMVNLWYVNYLNIFKWHPGLQETKEKGIT